MSLLRRVPFITTATALWWAYRNRVELGRWAAFAGSVPSRLARDETADLNLEARVRLALTADPATRNEPRVRVGTVRAGVVLLHVPSGSALVEEARRVTCRLPGVVDVRIEDPSLPLARVPSPVPA